MLCSKKVKNQVSCKEVCMEAPIRKIEHELAKANFVKKGRSWPKFAWVQYEINQIITLYNLIIKEITNYYSFVDNRKVLSTYLFYLLKGSCTKLLAAKFKARKQKKVFAAHGKKLNIFKYGNGLFEPGYGFSPWAFNTKQANDIAHFYLRLMSPASLLQMVCIYCGSNYQVDIYKTFYLKNLILNKEFLFKFLMKHKSKQIPLCRKCFLMLQKKSKNFKQKAV